MKILSVEWKNFNSYGNGFQRIDFDANKGNLSLLMGKNGSGKSSIAEIITFGWFGKVDGKKLSDLPNRINKELVVKIKFISKKKVIEIERGISPNIFRVHIDGEEYDQAGKINMQDRLETEFYDIPYSVFKNIIVISIEDFKSFLTMSSADKRNIIDKLFGFSIINQMRESLRSEVKSVKDNIKTLEDEINMIVENISSIDTKLINLKSSKQDKDESKKTEIISELKSLKAEYDKTKTSLKSIRDRYTDTDSNLKKINRMIYENKSKTEQIDNRLLLYNKSKCPSCGSDLHSGAPLEIKTKLEAGKSKLVNSRPSLVKKLEECQNNLKEIKNLELSIIKETSSIENQIRNLRNQLTSSIDDENGDFKHLKDLLQELEEKKQKRTSQRETETKNQQFLDIIENILGDNGVKNLALKTILPPLNANIASMASQMHLPYQISFDEKFNCLIKHIGQKISPKTLSTGQRKKTDFIIIIALLKLLKVRYSNLNLLFLDELITSVDAEGRHEIIKILQQVSKEIKLNTWVMNHSELPVELFDQKIETFMNGGFSSISIQEIN